MFCRLTANLANRQMSFTRRTLELKLHNFNWVEVDKKVSLFVFLKKLFIMYLYTHDIDKYTSVKSNGSQLLVKRTRKTTENLTE